MSTSDRDRGARNAAALSAEDKKVMLANGPRASRSVRRFSTGATRSSLALVGLGLLLGCEPSDFARDSAELDGGASNDSENPTKIVGGTQTNGYPSVGYFESGSSACTATLIDARSVLTAAHCINSTRGRLWIGGKYAQWSKAYVHEGYNSKTLDNDVAVAILDAAVSGITPSPLGTAALAQGQKITLVGYGYTSFSGGNEAGNKYVGTNTIASVGSTWFSYKGNANNCSGDSGGPTFIGTAVVGIHSSGEGNTYCSTTGYDVRVDKYASWIKSKATGSSTDGGGGGGSCVDTPGFVDAQGFQCTDWVSYNCAAAGQYGYSQAQTTSLLSNCRASCRLCSGGGTTGGNSSGGSSGGNSSGGTSGGSTGGDSCSDKAGFTDAQGYKCSDWVGYNCANASQYGYTQAQTKSLLVNCPTSCGLCSSGGSTGGSSGGSGGTSNGGTSGGTSSGGNSGGSGGGLDQWKAYFGYLHSHTSVSDGSGTPSQAFSKARSAGLDFFAVTEHDYYPDEMTSSDWSAIKQAADQAYVPGTFVTFRGFEWTSDTTEYQKNGLGLGHMTIINSQNYTSSSWSSSRTLNQLVSWLGTQDAIAFFNHPGQYGTTFDRFNFNKSDKIVGMELWNRSEDYYSKSGFYGQGFYDEALARGFYIGAGGGQDNHSADWGFTNEWRIGVLATELTRDSILGAFRARRFYSVRDRNLAVSFVCNGSQMGSRVSRGTATCTIQTRDGDGEATTRIELLRRGSVIQTWNPNSNAPTVTTSVQTSTGDYLYARIYQGSSWTAITAPIFFN